MKTQISMIQLLMVTSFTLFFSCGNAQNQLKSEEVLTGYMKVKDALVKTDAVLAADAANSLARLTENSNNKHAGMINDLTNKISTASEVSQQRVYFETLSEEVYQVLKESGGVDVPVYRQYCPMAFNNNGAYWLAAEKEINNPYFGSMMLHCGTVKEEL